MSTWSHFHAYRRWEPVEVTGLPPGGQLDTEAFNLFGVVATYETFGRIPATSRHPAAPRSHHWIDWRGVDGEWGDFRTPRGPWTTLENIYRGTYLPTGYPATSSGGTLRCGPPVCAAHVLVKPPTTASTVTFTLAGHSLSVVSHMTTEDELDVGPIRRYRPGSWLDNGEIQGIYCEAVFAPAGGESVTAPLLWANPSVYTQRPTGVILPLGTPRGGYAVCMGLYLAEDGLRLYAHLACNFWNGVTGRNSYALYYAPTGCFVTSFDAAVDWNGTHEAGLEFSVTSDAAVEVGMAACRDDFLRGSWPARWESQDEIHARKGTRPGSLKQASEAFLRPLRAGLEIADCGGHAEHISSAFWLVGFGATGDQPAVVKNPLRSTIGASDTENRRLSVLTVQLLNGWRAAQVDNALADWSQVQFDAVQADEHTANSYRATFNQTIVLAERRGRPRTSEKDELPTIRRTAEEVHIAVGLARDQLVTTTDRVTWPLVLQPNGLDYIPTANVGRGFDALTFHEVVSVTLAIACVVTTTTSYEGQEPEQEEQTIRQTSTVQLSPEQFSQLLAAQPVEVAGFQDSLRVTLQAVG